MKPGIDYVGTGTPFYCHDGRGKILLHKRSTNCRDEHGIWDSGSGQLEFGEAVTESVLREVEEEYGCKGEIDVQLPSYSLLRKHEGKKTHWLQTPFIIRVDPKEVRNCEPHKIEELEWFSLDNLPEPLHPGLQYALSHYGEFFTKHIGKVSAKQKDTQRSIDN